MSTVKLEQLGDLVKKTRGTRGLREVAKNIGVSPATLSRVESGKLPDLDTFSKLCQWLQINPGEVLGFTWEGPDSVSDGPTPTDPLGEVTLAHFRAEQVMRPETALHLGKLILAVQRSGVGKG